MTALREWTGFLFFACCVTVNCAGQVSEREIRRAVAKSVAVLETTAAKWFDKQTCYSCHHQSLPLMVFDLARRRGVEVDRPKLERVMRKTFEYLTDLDRAVQGSYVIDPVLNQGLRLVAGAPLGLPRSTSTGAYARLIARRQLADGHWLTFDERPPQSFSQFSATAFAVRTLQLFLPEAMVEERRSRVARAGDWLARHYPADTEDRVGQLLGLKWAENEQAVLNIARDHLLVEQRADGGWGQAPAIHSDAYATGESLAALSQAALFRHRLRLIKEA
jgi:N-acyl-D-amino-acid deacylase